MDEFGKDFLAGACRAVDEDGHIRLCHTTRKAQRIAAELVAAGNRAFVRQQCRRKLQTVMIGGGACRHGRNRKTDELSAKRLGHRESGCVFLDDHHPTGPCGAPACNSGIFTADRRLEGGAAYIGGRFHLAGSIASVFTDRQ